MHLDDALSPVASPWSLDGLGLLSSTTGLHNLDSISLVGTVNISVVWATCPPGPCMTSSASSGLEHLWTSFLDLVVLRVGRVWERVGVSNRDLSSLSLCSGCRRRVRDGERGLEGEHHLQCGGHPAWTLHAGRMDVRDCWSARMWGAE